MFRFVKQIFVSAMIFFGCNISGLNSLKFVSMNNQECRIRPEIININSNEPLFYPYNAKVNKCRSSYNNINDLCAQLCVPDVAKIIKLKVFNLMSRTNEIRYIKFHETCKCKCRLDTSVCNNKQRCNEGKCRCECEEFIDKGSCDKGFIWNPSNYECECDKPCDIGEYLDYENCNCRKKLVDILVEECTKNIDKVELAKITLLEHGNMCKCSCTL